MKRLLGILVVIFSTVQLALPQQGISQGAPQAGDANTWKGPILLKQLQLSNARNEELQSGSFIILFQSDSQPEKLRSLEALIAFSEPQIATSYSQIVLSLGDNKKLVLLGFHYNVANHLFIHGRYRIDENSGATSTLTEQGSYAFFSSEHKDGLIEPAISLFFSEELSSENERVNLDVELLCSKKWQVGSLELRDHQGNAIESVTDLDTLPIPLREIKMSFAQDGTVVLEGFECSYGDVKLTGLLQGTYKVFGGRLVLLKTKIGEQEFKWLIRVISQDENHVTATTNTQLFTPTVYSLDGLQFEDTVTFIPVATESKNKDEK